MFRNSIQEHGPNALRVIGAGKSSTVIAGPGELGPKFRSFVRRTRCRCPDDHDAKPQRRVHEKMLKGDSSCLAGDETPSARSCAGGPARQLRRRSCPCRVRCRYETLHPRDRKRTKCRSLACADPDRPPPAAAHIRRNEMPSSAALACARRRNSGPMAICVRAFMMVPTCDHSRSCVWPGTAVEGPKATRCDGRHTFGPRGVARCAHLHKTRRKSTCARSLSPSPPWPRWPHCP
jgi:hypothetical protein